MGQSSAEWLVSFVNVSMHRKKKKKSDVKEAFRQLLNKYKKRLQEDMHKVSSQILFFCASFMTMENCVR